MLHPNAGDRGELNGRKIGQDTLRGINVYFAAYVFILVASVLIVSVDNLILLHLSAVSLTTINNVGPGISKVGPVENFHMFSPLSKIVFSFDMLVGRLEIIPFLILLSPALWRKKFLRKGKYEKIKRNLIIAAVVIILLGLYYYIALPAVNIHSTEFWIFLGVLVLLAAALFVKKKKLSRYELKGIQRAESNYGGSFAAVVIVYLAGALLSSPIVNAKKYQQLRTVETGEFTTEIEELSFWTRFPSLTGNLPLFWETEKWEAMVDMGVSVRGGLTSTPR